MTISLKRCIVGIALLSSLAEGGDSMVCGKPSIRDHLKKDTQDVSEQTWADIETTAEAELGKMNAAVAKTNQELLKLEADAEAKKGQSTPSTITAEESKSLIGTAFSGGSTFPSAADAKKYDCGFGEAAFEQDNMDEIMGWYDTAGPAFTTVAAAELKGKGKAVERSVFEAACAESLGSGDTCKELCWDLGNIAVKNSAVGGVAMGSPTYAELVVMVEAKRKQLERQETEEKECKDSVETITALHAQFTKANTVLTKQKSTCSRTSRMLRMTANRLKKKKIEWEAAKVEDKKAQDALREAIRLQDEALANKEMAAENLRMWEEHMAALMKAIDEQTKVVRQTHEALLAADAASAAVSDFKDKLSTALNGLVAYYDEAVKQPLRAMGIREEVNIEDKFPAPSDTTAAKSLQAGLTATKNFCAGDEGKKLAKLPEIEADGAKLTSICDAQNWDVVASEVEAAVNDRRGRSIANLKSVQQKVKQYTGTVANKDQGEVEGVWKAMAIYGDTQFSKNYLSGWKFSQDGAKAGFMMELASALNKARERAATLWEEAKQALAVLEEEKVQVEQILEVAKEYLKEMIAEYEKATENRIAADKKAEEARAALLTVTAEKENLEKKVGEITQSVKDCEALVAEANASLKETHETAMGSFMELLHASEQEQGGSWD